MTSHAGLVASHIQLVAIEYPTQLPPKDLVDHSAMFILYLEAHVSSSSLSHFSN